MIHYIKHGKPRTELSCGHRPVEQDWVLDSNRYTTLTVRSETVRATSDAKKVTCPRCKLDYVFQEDLRMFEVLDKAIAESSAVDGHKPS